MRDDLSIARALDLLDPIHEAPFDRLVRLARDTLGAPLALVTLVRGDRLLFRSAAGLPEPWASWREIPLDRAPCHFVVQSGKGWVVPDARANPLLADGHATLDGVVGAYAGIPLESSPGEVCGTFCVIDRVPRAWTDAELDTLRGLAATAVAEAYLGQQVARSDVGEALRRSGDLFQALIENSSELIHVVDEEGRIRYMAPSVERVLGYRPEEMVGRMAHEYLHPEDLPAAAVTFEHDIQHPGIAPRRLELRLRHRDGSWRTLEVVGKVIESPTGGALAVVNSHDVTGRKRMEAELRSANESLRALIRASPAAIVSIDPDGTVRTWNSAAERIFGWSAAEVLDRPLPTVPDDHRDEFRFLLHRYARGESVTGLETRRRRRDGSVVDVSISAAPMHDDTGRVCGVMALVEDITERKRVEAEREKFLEVISHDLRNPLSTVLLSASAALQARLPLEHREYVHGQLGRVTLAAEQMSRLINDLSDAASLESGHFTLDRRAHLPAFLLREAAEVLGPLAEDRGVRLAVEPCDAPPVTADAGRVLQVLSNLVGNAIRFSPQRGVVTLRADAVAEGVRFSVSDTGPGIAEEHLPHLFDRYWQARRTPRGGAGLGLAIAKGIVEAHGGRIRVESAPGEGATFHFTLPHAM